MSIAYHSLSKRIAHPSAAFRAAMMIDALHLASKSKDGIPEIGQCTPQQLAHALGVVTRIVSYPILECG
jgi:hypothetical protein